MRWLDKTVLFSFDRSGFERHSRRFRAADLDVDLSGRTCAVTGASSGIGLETARALAARGAHVWMLCRDLERGARAADQIRGTAPAAQLTLEQLDVADLGSVRRFAERWSAEPLDVLVHNAGVLPHERLESPQGIELTYATNVVGPYLLTKLSAPRLARSPDARLIIVSSGGMYPVRLDTSDWAFERRRFDGVAAYAMTKRAQIVLGEVWAERLPHVTVSTMHPGWADTPSVERSLPRFHRLLEKRLRSPAQGADTVVWLAAKPRRRGESGRFWFDREAQDPYALPFTRESPRERARLLELCEELASR